LTTSVVLLHGGGTSARQWDLVLERLAAPALALDVPGRGDRPAILLAASVTVDGGTGMDCMKPRHAEHRAWRPPSSRWPRATCRTSPCPMS